MSLRRATEPITGNDHTQQVVLSLQFPSLPPSLFPLPPPWQDFRSVPGTINALENQVTHRQFKDRQGKLWDVWQVHPSAAERRFGPRRARDNERSGPNERRKGPDRRGSGVRETFHRAPVAEEFAYGWLCFETVGEKRRLAPVPEGWERADNETIEQWCCTAKPVTRRPSGSIRGTGGAEKLG